jgi:hypothetical protein
MRVGKLEVSFYGPFVTMLGRDPIEIYAPRCVGHYGSIFTTEKEAPLDHDPNDQGMNWVYAVTKSGILPNTSAITAVNGATHLNPPTAFALTNDPRRAWFRLQFPKPTHAVGIKVDPVQIKGTNAPAGTGYATALRLIFDYDMDSPYFELSLGGIAILQTTLQDYSASSPGSSSRFDVTVRLVGPFLFDPAHDDARACFEATAKLFQSGNTDLDWKADYSRMSSLARTGSDCGSPLLISF